MFITTLFAAIRQLRSVSLKSSPLRKKVSKPTKSKTAMSWQPIAQAAPAHAKTTLDVNGVDRAGGIFAFHLSSSALA